MRARADLTFRVEFAPPEKAVLKAAIRESRGAYPQRLAGKTLGPGGEFALGDVQKLKNKVGGGIESGVPQQGDETQQWRAVYDRLDDLLDEMHGAQQAVESSTERAEHLR